jgi:TRAP-type C4-dicarboxylate transport system permease small subunit
MPFYRPTPKEPAVLRVLGDALDIFVVLAGATIVSVMFINVLSRTILNVDIAWNTEFGEFVLIWATFIGCAAAARRGAHMRITEFVGGMPARARRAVEFTTRLGVLAVLTVLVWRGLPIVQKNWDQQMTVLYWPVGLAYLSMPVGSFLTAVFVAYETYRIARGASDPASDIDAEMRAD